MMNVKRLHQRAALRIREKLVRSQEPSVVLELPHAAWETLKRTFAHWQYVRRCGWRKAEQVCEGRLLEEIDGLIHQMQRRRSDLARRASRLPPPSIRALVEDLGALEDEFSEVSIDLQESRLSVVTDAITLEGIPLGPFLIALDWSKLPASHAYRVIAQAPNPAASNEEVVHPHVSNECLCEGAAEQAIRSALEHGRLWDFFVIVRQVLTTYNPNSPYVPLESWDGVPCTDCGGLTGDEYDTCNQCQSNLCEHCSTCCITCNERYCSSCLVSCGHCENLICAECRSCCESCSTTHCLECLNEEGVCQECLDRQAEEEAEEPAIHAHVRALRGGIKMNLDDSDLVESAFMNRDAFEQTDHLLTKEEPWTKE